MKRNCILAFLIFTMFACSGPSIENTNDVAKGHTISASDSEKEFAKKEYAIFVVNYEFCQLGSDISSRSNECKKWAAKTIHSEIVEITGWNEERIYRQKDELLLDAKRGSILGFKLKTTEIKRFTSYREASEYLEQNL